MMRAQDCTATNYATASQEGPQRPAQSPDSPTHCQINAVRRAPHFQTPANSNTNFSANQSPALFLAFCVLPWRPAGRIQTRRGASPTRPHGVPFASRLAPLLRPWPLASGLVFRRGGRDVSIRARYPMDMRILTSERAGERQWRFQGPRICVPVSLSVRRSAGGPPTTLCPSVDPLPPAPPLSSGSAFLCLC